MDKKNIRKGRRYLVGKYAATCERTDGTWGDFESVRGYSFTCEVADVNPLPRSGRLTKLQREAMRLARWCLGGKENPLPKYGINNAITIAESTYVLRQESWNEIASATLSEVEIEVES